MRERTRAGQAAARDRGVKVGRRSKLTLTDRNGLRPLFVLKYYNYKSITR
jgi:hypothetical protein